MDIILPTSLDRDLFFSLIRRRGDKLQFARRLFPTSPAVTVAIACIDVMLLLVRTKTRRKNNRKGVQIGWKKERKKESPARWIVIAKVGGRIAFSPFPL